MATNNESCREFFGLNTSEYAFLHDLAALAEEVKDCVSLAGFLKSCKSKTAKILGLGLDVYNQPLDDAIQEKIEFLEGRITKRREHVFPSKRVLVARLTTIEGMTDSQFNAALSAISDLGMMFLLRNAQDRQEIIVLRMENLVAANDLVADSLAPTRGKRKSKNGDSAKENGVPEFAFPNTYHVRGYGLDCELTLNHETAWTLEGKNLETGETFMVGDSDCTHTLSSWTMLGKIMRVLSGEYNRDGDNPLTVGKGDLKHPKLNDVNAGGTGRLMVKAK